MIPYISQLHEIDLNSWLNASTVHVGWSHIYSDAFENHMHLAVCTLRYPAYSLTNFAVAVFTSNHAYNLLSWYKCFISLSR